jgi:hypothetical protein
MDPAESADVRVEALALWATFATFGQELGRVLSGRCSNEAKDARETITVVHV